MSLRIESADAPAETQRVAWAAFPKGRWSLKMRDEFGTFYSEADFADLFSTRGQPAFSPWRLASVTITQFVEGVSDLPDTEVNFKIHQELKTKGLLPDKYLVDAGYPKNDGVGKFAGRNSRSESGETQLSLASQRE